jgi:anti-anti-sigma regulatory factor
MLRISKLSDHEGRTILRLDGEVVGPWVDELERICAEATSGHHAKAPRLILDLAGVSFLDAKAITLVRGLVTGHVSVTNYSVFIGEQLKEVSDDRSR